MRQAIEKLLQDLFLSPLGWALLCFLTTWFLLQTNKAKAAKRFLIAGVVSLLLFSSTAISDLLGIRLEREFAVRAFQDYPTAQAIVVLGGSASGILPPRLEVEENYGARVLGAARLYRAKKAPLILVSGGDPYRDTQGEARNQAIDLRDLLMEYGVPKAAIVLEEEAKNTFENAVFSQKLLARQGIKEILLVTSAYHIVRATRLYERVGLKVIPVPTSHEQVGDPHYFGWIPKASNLEKSTRFLKEYFGRAIGR